MDLFSCFSICAKKNSTVNLSDPKFPTSCLIETIGENKNKVAQSPDRIKLKRKETTRQIKPEIREEYDETRREMNNLTTDREDIVIVNYLNPKTGKYQRMFVRKRKLVDEEINV